MGRMDEIRRHLKKLLKKDFIEEHCDHYNRFFIRSEPTRIKEITQLLVEKLDGKLVAISANDEGIKGFDVVYHFDFSHQERSLHISMKVRLPRKNPVIDSITNIAWSANWAERELSEEVG
jgi:Ni,Fe-hydrogenase III component G